MKGALKVLFEGARGEAYNIGNPKVELSTMQMAQIIAEIYNLNIKINAPKKDVYLPSPISKMPINVSRLLSLGWKPAVNFSEGIAKTIEHSRGLNEVFAHRV